MNAEINTKKRFGWVRAELYYWYERLLHALGITDEHRLFRPYHIWRMFQNDIKPLDFSDIEPPEHSDVEG